jgi:endoglucanase
VAPSPAALPTAAPSEPPELFALNKRLGRGVNLGNALEAPSEGAWGVTLQEAYFKLIRDAGFDAVRIPVRWSAHAAKTEPYTIQPAFFERVDWAIQQALDRGLVAVVDMHHYEELDKRPQT